MGVRRGEEEGVGVGPAEERHTFRAYLHVAASMTGNLGKFSTEPAADGGGIKTKGESNKRERKKEGKRGEEREVDVGREAPRGDVRGIPDTAAVGSEREQGSKWVSRFQSAERGGAGGLGRGGGTGEC